MKWSATDVVAVLFAVALCVMITFPIFRSECITQQAARVYENLITAAIALVAAYVGAQIKQK